MRHSNNSYNQRAYAEKLFLHKGFCQIYRTSTHMYASVSLSEKMGIFVELNTVQQTSKASDGSERAFYCSQMYNNNNKMQQSIWKNIQKTHMENVNIFAKNLFFSQAAKVY